MWKSPLIIGFFALCGCVSYDASLAPIDEGNFALDPSHAFLSARVTHFGISDYMIDFTDFDAQLAFDPDTPAASQLSFQLNPLGLDTHYPDPEKKVEWESDLSTGARFLDGERFPSVTFVTTSIVQMSETTGQVTGDLNLRGTTVPITFDVVYNGTAQSPLDGGRRRIGFSATGQFARSDFGMTTLTQFVSDTVTITFTGEFLEASDS